MSTSKSRKFIRLLLFAAGAALIAVGLAVAVAFSSSFQTWAAHRWLAAHPEIKASVGSVAVGLQRVRVQDLRVEQQGVVATVPSLEMELSLFAAAFDRRVNLTRLEARGWTVDLARMAGASAEAPNAKPGARTAPPPTAAPDGQSLPQQAVGKVAPAGETVPAPAAAFTGVFPRLRLPVDLSLEGVQLEGEVVLPESRGRVKLNVRGGGFGAGREGRLEVAGEAALADPRASALTVRATIGGDMDSPRTLRQAAVKFEATAKGTQFPAGVQIAGHLAATRDNQGETYAASLHTPTRDILQLKLNLGAEASRLSGTWRVDMGEADVAPFALGTPLPAFAATGEGRLETDTAFSAIRARGKLAAKLNRLEVLRPELAAMGEMTVEADFDLAESAGVIAVERLTAKFGAAQPVAELRALQPFVFNPRSRELKTSDATRELVGVSLLGVPLAWAQPFVKQVQLAGGPLQGELAAMTRGGGLVVHSTAPIKVSGLTVTQAGKPLLADVDVTLGTTADYNPKGWQAELAGLTVRSDAGTLLEIGGRAGQLNGKDEPLRMAGKFTGELAAILGQPAATGLVALTGGTVEVEFAASLGAATEVHAKVGLTKLETKRQGKVVPLPAVAADIRADVSAAGPIAFNAPITVEMATRKSDAVLGGTFTPRSPGIGRLEANLASKVLVLEDLRTLADGLVAVDRPAAPGAGATPPPPTAAPPWQGLEGAIALRLERLVYSDTFQVNNVSGRIVLDPAKVRLEDLRVGLGENGQANLAGVLTYGAAPAPAYSLEADLAVKEFDPGPLLQSWVRGQPATVEGRFDVKSSFTSRAASLGELLPKAAGAFQISSKGGLFRGLPVSVATAAGNTGRVAGLIAAAGTAIGGLTGRKEPAAIASKSQAVAELAAALNPIAFDQLSVVVTRDAALNATLEDFALIAPELRLTGRGSLIHRGGSSFLDDSLAMEFKLLTRGRQGELWKYLGALEPATDDLGYAACTVPIRIGGSVGRPDSSELSTRLAALALEKAGVTEKASGLFNKLIGGGK